MRATGSGAGCGAYWPLCRGNVIPDLTILNTLIEFTHRVSSGVVGIGAVLLIIGAFFSYPKKHYVRYAAITVVCLVILEALLGAALVLFGLVEHNSTTTRIWVMSLHLINTFLLLAAITLTAAWSSEGTLPLEPLASRLPCLDRGIQSKMFLIIMCLSLLIITGVTGAITALSDTLFKPEYVGQHFFKELFEPRHVLQMLRVFHPVLALISSVVLALTVVKFGFQKGRAQIFGIFVLIFIIFQIFVGMFNLVFLTPIVLQLVHLFLADALWIVTILYFNEFYVFPIHALHSEQREP